MWGTRDLHFVSRVVERENPTAQDYSEGEG
jgi:hypothetical protein